MQSNSRVNYSRVNDSAKNSRVDNSRANDSRLNNSRLNASHLHETKKPFTQPGTRQSRSGNRQPAPGEHLCSSERMDSSERLDRGGGGQVKSRRLYIYTYTAP